MTHSETDQDQGGRITQEAEHGELGPVLAKNIQNLAERRRSEEEKAPLDAKISDAVTKFAGSLTFVYLHLGIVAVWTLANLGAIPLIPAFDPTFVILATAASVEAIFLSTFVLISQNRDAAVAERRAQLDLHVNLLAEREITTIASMVRAIAQKLDVQFDPSEVGDVERRVAPEQVLDRLQDKA